MKFSLMLSTLSIAVVATGCSSKSDPPKAVPQVQADSGGLKTASASGISSAAGVGAGLDIRLVEKADDGSSPYAAESDHGITAVSCLEVATENRQLLKERLKRGAAGLNKKVHFTFADKTYEVVNKELSFGGGPSIDAVEIESGKVSKFDCDDTTQEI